MLLAVARETRWERKEKEAGMIGQQSSYREEEWKREEEEEKEAPIMGDNLWGAQSNSQDNIVSGNRIIKLMVSSTAILLLWVVFCFTFSSPV